MDNKIINILIFILKFTLHRGYNHFFLSVTEMMTCEIDLEHANVVLTI